MHDTFLNYATPARPPLEWRFIRLSLLTLLLVAGWFCYSLYLWHRFGDVGVGFRPIARVARDMMTERIVAFVGLMTALNFSCLVAVLPRSSSPIPVRILYLALAFLPAGLLLIIEARFGTYIVE